MARSKYSPTENTGDERFRVAKFSGDNPLGGVPSLTFHEDLIMLGSSGEERMIERSRVLKLSYKDPEAELVIYDPATGEPTEEAIPMARAFQIFFSLGRTAQVENDAALEQEE